MGYTGMSNECLALFTQYFAFWDVMPWSLASNMNREGGLSMGKSYIYPICILKTEQKPLLWKCCNTCFL